MNVLSDEIIGRWIEYATRNGSPAIKDLWLLSDFIRGRKLDPVVIIKILEKFDQTKEEVKIIRRELNL